MSEPDHPRTAVPTCYRHGDRETYLRCSRCDRPVCPDCMRGAPVGQHCLECVAAAGRGTRPARTVFGGAVRSRPAAITRALIVINVLVFLAELGSGGLEVRFGMWPRAVADGQVYRLITAAFLHDSGNPLHIAFNMFALFVVGSQLEPLLGAGRFLALYLLSALGGSVLGLLVGNPDGLSVGASGAIFGLFGALLVVARRLSADLAGITGVLLVNFAITFLVPRVDWRAHVGGLVTGALLALAFAYAPRRLQRPLAVAAPLGVGVVLVGLVALRTAALT